MSDIVWKSYTYHELSRDQLFACLQLRMQVFVVEQTCAYEEIDRHDCDRGTIHVFGVEAGGDLAAYARLLPAGKMYPEVSCGRFVVRADRRGQGLGRQLIAEALRVVHETWPGCSIKIASQVAVEGLYERFGFGRVSEPYLDAGVPHIEMVRHGEHG